MVLFCPYSRRSEELLAKIGIGIDTGGTYTDAVAYDFGSHTLLSSAKAQTTREDLSIGIGNALDALPREQVRAAEMVSLSTTLATNASVEDKGGRARLLFIGADRWVVERYGPEYGLPQDGEIFYLEANTTTAGEVLVEPDWEAFRRRADPWIQGACGIGIVDRDAMDNGGVLERKGQELVSGAWDLPVVCGHEMFSDLNSLRRGSSVLLNARLVPLITEFLRAARLALTKRSVTAPVLILRSDGTLMSERFAVHRPVETLVCGPAASVMGGLTLSAEKDSVIIDMGGTTTDVAIIEGGVPRRAREGVDAGKWKTLVKGLSVRSFGLGGDSAVRWDRNGRMRLEPTRLLPLSVAAARWPSVTTKLRGLLAARRSHTLPLHELFCPVRDIAANPAYTAMEREFCRSIQAGPLLFEEAAEAIGTSPYNLDVSRLEEEGVVLRSGLTPTDIMHLRGDFTRFDAEASALGVTFVSACVGLSRDGLLEAVYDAVKRALYGTVVRVLLEDQEPSLTGLDELIDRSWDLAKRRPGAGLLGFRFATPAALVGIGAPIHIFLPAVAEALGTRCVIPANAGVANALGAIAGT
ncbi:MAG TPA: hydantoinase/oxoprolinase family protein, partial [Spirochaetia bacterium]|nr:hydantoinase/oxoprolinase family protein [Spirochaetia bacterium]